MSARLAMMRAIWSRSISWSLARPRSKRLSMTHLHADCEQRAEPERGPDSGDAGVPAEHVVDRPQHRRANQTAQEVARQIDAAGGAAIGRGGTADEAGRGRLRRERADGDQDHA